MKDLKYGELFELYKNLLTELRKDIAYKYYLCDLSMGEIAAETGMSRQGVNDCLKKTREQLDDFESKLKLLSKLFIIKNRFGEEIGEQASEILKD